jgi:hypothetical protein
MEKDFDFFGDFGSIPRDVIDIILHNLNQKDVESLGQVNRFFNAVIKNEDEESNPLRKKDLLIYTPKYNNGLYYKFFDDFIINKTKSLFLAHILNNNKNIPRNLYYFEILKSRKSKDISFFKHEGYILESKSLKYNINPSNIYDPNPNKNTIYITFNSYFEVLYGETGLRNGFVYNFSSKPLKKEIYIDDIDDVDKKNHITNLNKLKDIVNNNKEENFTFIIDDGIENINERTKIGIKKLHFI